MEVVQVVLSGGVGSRLWPLSRKSQPKQYLPLFNGCSLFQLTLKRNRALIDEVMVVGNRDHHHLSEAELATAGIANYTPIIEAVPRNTAAAIAFAALSARPDDVLLVTPSDHIITNEELYQQNVDQAVAIARTGALVTFGIQPTKPETGYGYIEYKDNDVLGFREKPDAPTALAFVATGCFLWNSGMFCFEAGVYLNELRRFEPLLYQKAQAAWERSEAGLLPLAESLDIPAKSIDYAVMERSNRIKVIPAGFGWSDLGSYEALWEYFEAEGQSQHFKQNNLVLGTTQKHIELIGVEGLVVVETKDAILVLHKPSSQEVKKLYERLEVEKPRVLA